MTSPFNIAYCCDNRFLPPTLASILSVSRRELPTTPLHFHLFLEGHIVDELEQFKKQLPAAHQLKVELISTEGLGDIPVNSHIPRSSYTRLLMVDRLPSSIERILYLDGDTLCLGRVSGLFEILKDENFIVAGAENPDFNRHEGLGLAQGSTYVNAGVLLIDCRQWREHNVLGRSMEIIRTRPECLKQHDQDLLNMVCAGHIRIVPPVWNAQSVYLTDSRYRASVWGKEQIIHFTTNRKPWNGDDPHPYGEQFLELMRQTPFGFKGKRTLYKRFKWLVRYLKLYVGYYLHVPDRTRRMLRSVTL